MWLTTMLDRTIYAFILTTATASLAACKLDSEHCIGDCSPLSATSTGPQSGTTTEDSTSNTTSTTDLGTTHSGSPTTTSTGTSTSGSDPRPSCRAVALCEANCILQIPRPTPPDYDPQECLSSCPGPLSDAEALKLAELKQCAEDKCAMTDECMMNEDACETCYLVTLGNEELPLGDPCEAQAKACQ